MSSNEGAGAGTSAAGDDVDHGRPGWGTHMSTTSARVDHVAAHARGRVSPKYAEAFADPLRSHRCDRVTQPRHRLGRGRRLASELRGARLSHDPGLHHAYVEVEGLALPAVVEAGGVPGLGVGYERGQGRIGRSDPALPLAAH